MTERITLTGRGGAAPGHLIQNPLRSAARTIPSPTLYPNPKELEHKVALAQGFEGLLQRLLKTVDDGCPPSSGRRMNDRRHRLVVEV